MASISRTKTGLWRAEVYRRGIRDSGTFKTQEDAETWSKNTEANIIGGIAGETITLTVREMFDLYARSKERARAYGIPYNLTREQVASLFASTGGRCSVTGILFSRAKPPNCSKRPWYPSLDRINSNLPYALDNCRFVCVAANVAMGEWGDWVLRSMVNAMTTGSLPQLPNFKPVGEPLIRRRRRRRSRQNHGTETGTHLETTP